MSEEPHLASIDPHLTPGRPRIVSVDITHLVHQALAVPPETADPDG